MKLFFLSISIFVLSACGGGSKKQRESYGLTKIEITLPDDKKADFIADFRGDIPYRAEIRINGQENQGTISPAGASSISLYKKSLDCKIEVGSSEWEDQSFRLSAQKTDTSMLRSIVALEYYKRLGLLVPTAEPVVVYLNGDYWGLYIKIERVTKKFFKRRKLEASQAYKADNGARFSRETWLDPNKVFDVRIGDKQFEDMVGIARALENTDRNRDQLDRLVNVDSFRKLAAGMVLLNHWDSAANNFHVYRLKNQTQYQALPWDLDATFDLQEHPYSQGHLIIGGYNILFQYAVNRDAAAQYVGLRQNLNGDFNGTELDAIVAPSIEKMRSAFKADPFLGGRGFTVDAEYAKLKSDAISWWSSLDQELIALGY